MPGINVAMTIGGDGIKIKDDSQLLMIFIKVFCFSILKWNIS